MSLPVEVAAPTLTIGQSVQRVRVAGCPVDRDGYFHPQEEESLIQQIVASRAQLLFLAISTRQKENWANENMRRLGPIVCQGVEAALMYCLALLIAPLAGCDALDWNGFFACFRNPAGCGADISIPTAYFFGW